MDETTPAQILDLAVCISQSVTTLKIGINPTILPSFEGKLEGRVSYLTLIWQPVLEKENSKFKPNRPSSY